MGVAETFPFQAASDAEVVRELQPKVLTKSFDLDLQYLFTSNLPDAPAGQRRAYRAGPDDEDQVGRLDQVLSLASDIREYLRLKEYISLTINNFKICFKMPIVHRGKSTQQNMKQLRLLAIHCSRCV